MPVIATTSTARRARTEKRRITAMPARRAVSASTARPPIQVPTAVRCTTSKGTNSQRGDWPASCAPNATATTTPTVSPKAPNPGRRPRWAAHHTSAAVAASSTTSTSIRRTVPGEADRNAATAPVPSPPPVAAPAPTCHASPKAPTLTATTLRSRQRGSSGPIRPGRRQTVSAAATTPTSSSTPATSSQRPVTCQAVGSCGGVGLATGPEPAPTANANEPASTWPSSADTIRQLTRYDPSLKTGSVAVSTSARPSGWRTWPRRTCPSGPCKLSACPSGRTASENATRSSAGARATRVAARGLVPTTKACASAGAVPSSHMLTSSPTAASTLMPRRRTTAPRHGRSNTPAILLRNVGDRLSIPSPRRPTMVCKSAWTGTASDNAPTGRRTHVIVVDAVGHALSLAAAMAWEILWALILGFAISGAVQAVVSKAEMGRLLPDDSPRSLTIACGLGAASSSCSYAAVAMARSVFRKGADFTSAMAFQFASTNLVVELGIILAVLLGWQFTAAEFVGGPLMIVLLALLFRALLRPPLVREAREQADKGLVGVMEGHAAMDMSVTEGSLWSRIRSPRGFTAISHYFAMDWASVWKDIAGGLLIAGALGAWVPASFWQGFFLTSHPLLARLWGPLVGQLVAVLSFVCSIGNVPLAAVLWNGGISFGGVVAFIFADLIVLPILNIYRKYYGARMSLFLFGTFYLTMAAAGLGVDLLFEALGLVPATRSAKVVEASITLNYTTVLNLLFLVLAAVLVVRFLRTKGPEMLRMMSAPTGHGPPRSPGAAGQGH